MTETKQKLTNGSIFWLNDKVFLCNVLRDEDMGPPWEEHDGHGIVSDWTQDAAEDGQRVLSTDRYSHLYYDIPATVKLAMKDGWGIGPEKMALLEKSLGHKPTKKEIAIMATEEDYCHMKAWCDDDWNWVGVVVTLLKEDEDAPSGYFETKHKVSLWGIESSDESYLDQVAYELAEELC